jgi:hypothetical protein
MPPQGGGQVEFIPRRNAGVPQIVIPACMFLSACRRDAFGVAFGGDLNFKCARFRFAA